MSDEDDLRAFAKRVGELTAEGKTGTVPKVQPPNEVPGDAAWSEYTRPDKVAPDELTLANAGRKMVEYPTKKLITPVTPQKDLERAIALAKARQYVDSKAVPAVAWASQNVPGVAKVAGFPGVMATGKNDLSGELDNLEEDIYGPRTEDRYTAAKGMQGEVQAGQSRGNRQYKLGSREDQEQYAMPAQETVRPENPVFKKGDSTAMRAQAIADWKAMKEGK